MGNKAISETQACFKQRPYADICNKLEYLLRVRKPLHTEMHLIAANGQDTIFEATIFEDARQYVVDGYGGLNIVIHIAELKACLENFGPLLVVKVSLRSILGFAVSKVFHEHIEKLWFVSRKAQNTFVGLLPVVLEAACEIRRIVGDEIFWGRVGLFFWSDVSLNKRTACEPALR